MSGHSKWHNIKRKKETTDAKKSKVFSKLSRLILVAAQQGGGDVGANPTLRLTVERAKYAGMPKANIEKAIKKAMGVDTAASYEEAMYEGFGPNGVAFLVITLTDNKNRTVADLRTVFSKNGGSLGAAGSTSYIFKEDPTKPSFFVDITDHEVLSKLEKLVFDLEDNDDVQDVFTNFKFFEET